MLFARCDFFWVKNKKQMQISARECIRTGPSHNSFLREFPFATPPLRAHPLKPACCFFGGCARACVFVCVCVPGSRARIKPPVCGRKGGLRTLLARFPAEEVPHPLLGPASLSLFPRGPRVGKVRCDFSRVENKKELRIHTHECIRKGPFHNSFLREFLFAICIFCNQDLIPHMSGSSKSNAKNTPLFEVVARRQKIPFRR